MISNRFQMLRKLKAKRLDRPKMTEQIKRAQR